MNADADITAEDREGRPVLVAKVHYDEASDCKILGGVEPLWNSPETVRFGMLVDPSTIRVFRRDFENPASVAELDTVETLSRYSPLYPNLKAHRGFKPIFRVYLQGIATSWLSDLAERWKGGEPPGLAVSDRIGLLECLAGGTVTNEELMRDRSLS